MPYLSASVFMTRHYTNPSTLS